MNSRLFNRQIAAGRDDAEQHLATLERTYLSLLRAEGRHAADRFTALTTDHLVADATNPGWTPPEDSQLIDQETLAQTARQKTKGTHKAALKAVVAPVLADVGIAYDLTNPLISGLLDGLGVRAQDLGDAIRGEVASAVLAGYQQGLSVPNTAKLIREAADEIAPARAAMLARTDLVGLANGASVAAAQMIAGADEGEAEGALAYKSWLATSDERTRETHAEADGQIVPLDQPFDVGGEQLAFPGDPGGSDEECCNCRCTVTYLSAAEAGEAGEDPALALAAAMQAPTDAVASTGTMIESPDDTLTADVTVTVADQPADAQDAAPQRWRAILCIEGQETQDNASLSRMLAVGETTWRDLPLPLGVMYETPHSDEVKAELCGMIETIYRDQSDFRVIWGEGVFNADEQGQRAAARIADLSLRGVSIDPYVPEIEMFDTEAPGNGVAHTLLVMHNPVICAATVCPVQALDGAQISLVASTEQDIMPLRIESCFVLTASQLPTDAVAEEPLDPRVAASLAKLDQVARPERFKEYKLGMEIGIYSLNDCLAAEGLARVDGGDERAVPMPVTAQRELGERLEQFAALGDRMREALDAVAAHEARTLALVASLDELTAAVANGSQVSEALVASVKDLAKPTTFHRDENGKLASISRG